MSVYPRRVDHARAYDVFLDLVLDEGYDPMMIISKATSYGNNVDPEIFTDKKVSTREWFVKAYRGSDASSVEKKYGFVYPDPPIPPEVTDVRSWCEDDRRKWVGQIANHVLNGAPLPE